MHEAGHAFGLGHTVLGATSFMMSNTLQEIENTCSPTLWDRAAMMRVYQSR